VTAITAIRAISGHAGCMENADVVYIPNLAEYGQVPQQSILSSTLLKDSKVKVLLFRFAAGQELSAHTAAVPAMLQFVAGEAELQLGDQQQKASPGTFVYMPAKLEHSVKAITETVMLLILLSA